MSLVYKEREIASQPGKPFFISSDIDPTDMYITHFKNSLYLTFFLKNGTYYEKTQAAKELIIAERKMTYWKRRSGFDQKRMLERCEEEKRLWAK